MGSSETWLTLESQKEKRENEQKDLERQWLKSLRNKRQTTPKADLKGRGTRINTEPNQTIKVHLGQQASETKHGG
jgi:hypothetical protein